MSMAYGQKCSDPLQVLFWNRGRKSKVLWRLAQGFISYNRGNLQGKIGVFTAYLRASPLASPNVHWRWFTSVLEDSGYQMFY